jgi:hypothetical protein
MNAMPIRKSSLGLIFFFFFIRLEGCSFPQPSATPIISSANNNSHAIENTITVPSPGDLRPPADGFYLVSNGKLEAIPGLSDDSSLDLPSLPSTTDNPPTFSVKGDNFPLGILFLNPYIAGIGVDVKYNDTSATITKIYDNSPAQAAGLQVGDLIISVNGVPVKGSLLSQYYTPVPNDLLGPMTDKLKLEVVIGTNDRVLELPRTYKETIGPGLAFPPIKFEVEPKGDYVLIRVPQAMELGAYRFEFIAPSSGISGGLGGYGSGGIYIGPSPTPLPTLTPTQTPVPIFIPVQKWAFILR